MIRYAIAMLVCWAVATAAAAQALGHLLTTTVR